ncbi:MAG: 2-dehydropantoate 2-reductase [Adlercreutzia sp.]|uniref:ketopantoate reductase family protein n=1 Tax=uncultured Adlercreutzia sp. TaxID=875803 RepID=UPI00216BE90F|nr:2-dehydropantoate 2-reductase [uncultured Adlercreutzia sp.]MCI8424985.1 2-dehydropantoate 2-reductase [Adlercreutzia sp.]
MNDVKRVAVVGFGSLGAMYAGCFGRAMGAGGVFVVADEARTATYRSEPTVFNGEPIAATYLTYEEAAEQARAMPFDVVLYAVKFGALEEAMAQSAPMVGPDTAVISVLNGITSEEVLAERFGWERVLLCVAQQMDARKVGFTVTAGCVGVMALGVRDAGDPVQRANLARVTMWLDAIGQPYLCPDDIQHQLWGKLICNVGVNQACAVYDCCFSGIQAEGEARRAMIAAMNEVAVVGRACGIALTDADVAYWLDIIDHLNPAGLPSLRQDVLAGRPTEVDLFAGTISRLGRAHGIPTPQNDEFLRRIREIEASYL